MSTARSLVRLAFAGLFVNVVAVACVVSSSDDDDDATACDPGATKACTCSNGEAGTKKCNASGSGYAACDCSDTTNGGSGGGGAGGEGNSSTGGTNSGGQGGGGAGGEANTQGGAGADSGGAAGAGGSGGAGGDPGVCAEDPDDSCANCYQQGCCDEFVACLSDNVTSGDDCATQFYGIMGCVGDKRALANVTSTDLEGCALMQGGNGSAWTDGLRPTVKPLIDCVAGGEGWEGKAWGDLACKASCFTK